jgi:excinuclease ABC subunit B
LKKEWPKLPLVEGHRLKQRTLHDMEMIEETGYCKGIENYSRYFDKRKIGERPYCLLDYFPEDFLFIKAIRLFLNLMECIKEIGQERKI